MIVFIDIEDTVIDDLTTCNWLEENCAKIKSFLEKNEKQIELVHIYTWGWTKNLEIDKEIILNIYEKLGVPTYSCGWCITKESSVDFCINDGWLEEEDKETAMIPGMMSNEFALDKTMVFLLMTRDERNKGNTCVLIDDTAETNWNCDENAITINPIDL